MDAIESGASLKTIARQLGIPPNTLGNYLSGRSLSTKQCLPPILTHEEKSALEKYMVDMANYGHPLFMDQICLKFSFLTQDKTIPFTDSILGSGWVCWFKKRHLSLAIRQSQGLEVTRAKGLCAKNLDTFYKNLKDLYGRHHYPPHHI